MLKVLIPVDGSPASIRALKLAIDQLPKASFVIVNVQNPAALGLGGGGGIMPLEWIEQQEERRPGKHCNGLLPSAARRELLRYSFGARRDCGNDRSRSPRGHAAQIFMGTRGLGGVRGLVLGSVATHLLHLAKCR